MDKIDIKNLTGKCLISTPERTDRFAGTVIYICHHTNDGVMGFIVNKRIKDFTFQELIQDSPIPIVAPPMRLYNGGPSERTKGFVLHSDDYHIDESLKIGDGISITSSITVLQEIAFGKGPKKRMLILGYAGWTPKDLELEISNNEWLIAEPTPELIFGEDDENKWTKAMSSLGMTSSTWMPRCGHS